MGDKKKGISGGEKRRLAFASEVFYKFNKNSYILFKHYFVFKFIKVLTNPPLCKYSKFNDFY